VGRRRKRTGCVISRKKKKERPRKVRQSFQRSPDGGNRPLQVNRRGHIRHYRREGQCEKKKTDRLDWGPSQDGGESTNT